MKHLFINTLLIATVCYATTIPLYGQEEVAKDKYKLHFNLTLEKSDSLTAQGEGLYYIESMVDRKAIKNIERLYVKVFRESVYDYAYGQVLTGKQLKEIDKKGDKALKKVLEDKDQVTLQFGPFPLGDYLLNIRIVNDNKEHFIDEHNLTISDDEESSEG